MKSNVFIKSNEQSNVCIGSVMTGKGRTQSKTNFFTRLITILLLVLGVGINAWADTTVIIQSSTDVGTGTSASGNNSVSKNGITISCTAGGFAISGGEHYRLASSSTTTITSTIGNIKSIIIYGPTGTGSYSISKFGSNSGWTLSSTQGTYTWTGNAASVTVQAKSGQVRPTKFEIICESSDPTISLNKSSTSIEIDATETLTATTTNPANAAVTWESNATGVATVNSSGTVTGVSPGTATIKAKITDSPTVYAECVVTVTLKSRTISMAATDMNLTVGGSTQTRTGTLSAGTDAITYSSDDTDVATVDENTGKVTPVGEGSCTITAHVDANGDYDEASAFYTVNVTDPSMGNFTWNLTTNSYSSASTSSVVWTSSFATMTLSKGSGTNANNYLGGVSGHTETRFYNNNNLSISPASGYQITKVEITTSTTSFIIGTWVNATVTQNTSPVTIVPTNGSSAISTTPTGTTKVTGVTVYYKAVSSGPIASDLAVTSPLAVTVGNTANISYTTSSSGAMTFTSNNTSIATVDASGKVTGVAVGTTTISVSQAADASYLASDEKTVTVNVSAAPSVTTYTKVTDVSGLEEGNEYILVYESGTSARVMGAVTTIGASISGFTITDNSIVVTDEAVNVLTLSKNGSLEGNTKYRFFTSLEEKMLCWNSGNSLAVDEDGASNKYDWFLEYSGSTLTITNVGTTARKLQYNTGSPRFACYEGTQSAVALYVKEETGTAPTFTPSSIANQNLVVGATYETAEISVNSGGTLSATSSDEDVATVTWNSSTNKATVTALSAGETTIKIKAAKNGEYKSGELSFTVTVVAPTIELNKTSARLEIGGTETLTATLTNAGGATVDWSTSDDAIVSISGTGATRTITAVSAGTATITASINVNGYDYEATCEVTVQAHLEEGDYVIEYDGRYMKNEIVNNRLGSDDNCSFTTSGKAINPDASIVWHIAKSGDYYTIYNAAEDKYAASTGTENRAQLLASGTDDKAKWSVDGGTGETWDFVNKFNEGKGINSHLRYNPGYGFACYAESFSERLILHPVVTGPWIMLNKNSTGLDLGWTEVLTATTNHPEATVTWTSSDPAKVSVSADGAKCTITGVVAGEATITASITVSGTVYSETCHVKVGPVKVYQKVTSASGLVADKNYILVYESGTSARLMGSVNKHGGSTYYGESLRGYTITDNKIAVYDEAVNVLTLSEGAPSGYAFETSIENEYLSWTSGNSLSTTATKAGSSSWELTFTSGELTVTNVETSSRELHYNLGSPRFACYDKSGQQAVALYVEVPHYAFRVYNGSSTDYENVLVTDAAPTLTGNQVAVLIRTLTPAELEAMPSDIKTAPNVVVNGVTPSLSVSDYTMDGETKVYHPFYVPDVLTSVAKVSYSRSNTAGWNSVCLPFSIPFENVEDLFGTGAEVYQLTGLNSSRELVFTKLASGKVPAGEPVLVYSGETDSWTANVEASFDVSGAVADSVTIINQHGTVKLLGSYSEIVPGTVAGSTLYKLKADGSSFGTMSATAKVFPFRMYIKYTPPSSSPAPARLGVKIRIVDSTAGDLNSDKFATIADLTTLVNMVNGQTEPTDAGDVNGDGEVNQADVDALLKILTRK